MNTESGIFDSKLHELERQYGKTVGCLRSCQQETHEEVRQGLQAVWQEYRENELLMRQCAAGSRSPAVAALSEAQLEYDLAVQRILRNELPGYLHSEGNDRAEDQAEAAGLYGEYAIDFAAQAMRHALLAVLSAIDLEMSCEEQAAEKAQGKPELRRNCCASAV